MFVKEIPERTGPQIRKLRRAAFDGRIEPLQIGIDMARVAHDDGTGAKVLECAAKDSLR